MWKQRAVALIASIFTAVGVLSCGSHAAPIPTSASCDDLLATDPHLLLHLQPVVELVRAVAGPANADERAGATVSICIDNQTSGRGSIPAAVVIEVTALTCSDWLRSSPAKRARLAESYVGGVNLSLRVKGTTASCMHQNPATIPVAEVISSIAHGYPYPVTLDESSLPPTLDPGNPDQCEGRMQAAPLGDGTNEALIDAGLEDCVAMGY